MDNVIFLFNHREKCLEFFNTYLESGWQLEKWAVLKMSLAHEVFPR